MADPRACFACRREFSGAQLIETPFWAARLRCRVCPMCIHHRLRTSPPALQAAKDALWQGLALVILESLDRPTPSSTPGDLAARELALQMMGEQSSRTAILELARLAEVGA